MADARTITGVRRKARRSTTPTTSGFVQHEIVVTARLLVHWKNEIADAVAGGGGDLGALIKKRVACEEHLERLIATLDEIAVREQLEEVPRRTANTK